MILTLSLNPAVDVTIRTERIIFDDRTYITDEIYQPGGKGINAARVLHLCGATVESIAPYGGAMGEHFARLVMEMNVPVTLVNVAGETRRNLAIIDDQGLTVKLDQRGEPLSADELERIEAKVLARLDAASWLTLCGSIPPGAPSSWYARMISEAKSRGVETLLDTSGEALAEGLGAGPSLAKPNRAEAERLLGRSLLTEKDSIEAAEEIRAMGAKAVILSLGSQGAAAATAAGRWKATPREVQTGSPIGAGDVLGATAVWKLSLGAPFEHAFRWGVAAATAAASKPGLGCGGVAEIERMLDEIDVREIQRPATAL